VVGGGTKALPDALRLDLELLDERRFGSGFVHLRYRLGPRVYSDPLITRSHTAA
jgi:hypothetical protein